MVGGSRLSSAALRVLYRSLLRACDNGSRPEVFSWRNAALAADALPESPGEVVSLIHGRIADASAEAQADIFAALREASTMARALHPPCEGLPSTLPAFIFPSRTLMPGEVSEFVLFEPRYLKMARRILTSAGGLQPDVRFAHLPVADRGGIGVVASVLQHKELPDGRMAVQCLAGPRCRVTTAELEPIEAADGAASPPLLHVGFELAHDADIQDEAADLELARDCLRRLGALAPLDQPALASNLPPVLSAERLSLWLCHVLLPANDATSRMAWLRSDSTRERLRFCAECLSRAENAHSQAKTGGGDSSTT